MTTEQIKQAIADGIAEGFKNPNFHCRYSISAEDHQAQHAAMQKFIEFTGKVDNLKWSVLKKLISWMVITAFTFGLYWTGIKYHWFGG
jgi:hypothetical protein